MPFPTLLGQAAGAVFHRPKLILVQLTGNAVLFALFYLWLTLPEGRTADLLLSAVLLLVILVGMLWLQGATLAGFHTAGSARTLARRLPWFAVWAVMIVAVLVVSRHLAHGHWRWPWLAGLGVAAALLPIAGQAAAGRPWRGALAVLARPVWWLAVVCLLVSGYLVPALLIAWVPKVAGLAAESVSFGLRFGVAYLLLVLSWLVLAAVWGRLAGKGVPDGPG